MIAEYKTIIEHHMNDLNIEEAVIDFVNNGFAIRLDMNEYRIDDLIDLKDRLLDIPGVYPYHSCGQGIKALVVTKLRYKEGTLTFETIGGKEEFNNIKLVKSITIAEKIGLPLFVE